MKISIRCEVFEERDSNASGPHERTKSLSGSHVAVGQAATGQSLSDRGSRGRISPILLTNLLCLLPLGGNLGPNAFARESIVIAALSLVLIAGLVVGLLGAGQAIKRTAWANLGNAILAVALNGGLLGFYGWLHFARFGG